MSANVTMTLSHDHIAEDARRAEALRERAANLEMLDELLSTLSGVLDVREVFDRVSDIARQVLPHDAMSVPMLTEDRQHLRIHASHGFGVAMPKEMPLPGWPFLYETWDAHIVDDIPADPFFSKLPSGQAGLKSVLVIPIRRDGVIYGAVNFYSHAVGRFTRDDVLIGRRIADHIVLALSHQTLAEERGRTAALRERAANLQMLDDLLATLTGVLDVREVFERVSELSKKVLPHDAVSIAELIDGNTRLRMYAGSGLGDLPMPFESPVPSRHLVSDPWDFIVVDDMCTRPEYADSPGARAGMLSMLAVPIRLEGRLWGGLGFYARASGRFTRDDVLIARRIADHVALAISHQRLAEQSRQADELRLREANLELLDSLLEHLVDEGELQVIVERVSAIAKKVIPHDAMTLPVLLPDGLHARMYASTAPDAASFPEIVDIPENIRNNPNWDHDLVDDMREHPAQTNLAATKLGYRSALRVPVRFDGKFGAAVAFFSFTPRFFKPADVLMARRVADRIALNLARERGVAALKRADEATARATRLESRVRVLTEELDARTGYRRVVGESRAWRAVLTEATQVAPTDTTALLLGESGTGKEVVARFIHRASSRRDGPFIALNCAALPEQLLEAELFGYERGAFTGATQSKPGQLEQAGGGTLFLDEVAEMAPSAQAKFLRVLQEKEFQRLGGTRVLRTDARVMAATNRDLQQAIAKGHFREDLYYRLNVFAIHLPPLRDRRQDVLALSEAFLTEIARGLGCPPSGISREARDRLVEYHWPGNVRELRNILERAAILCEGGLILSEHLSLGPSAEPGRRASIAFTDAPVRSAMPPPAADTPVPPLSGDLKSMERTMIERALQDARFNKSKAAQILGVTRAQLYGRMKRYGLE